ncbi:hypothetical protein M422DRAFT_244979 [Sphaerobolus stellatus SS14]|nr:hypothetical protein M422DRAFT_244979 [Sphaerobolus stellatus SS14]
MVCQALSIFATYGLISRYNSSNRGRQASVGERERPGVGVPQIPEEQEQEQGRDSPEEEKERAGENMGDEHEPLLGSGGAGAIRIGRRPERRGANNLTPTSFKNNREYLPEITSKDNSDPSKWFIQVSDITKGSIDCFRVKAILHWDFIPNNERGLSE